MTGKDIATGNDLLDWRSFGRVVLGRENDRQGREAYLIAGPFAANVRLHPHVGFRLGWFLRGHVVYRWELC